MDTMDGRSLNPAFDDNRVLKRHYAGGFVYKFQKWPPEAKNSFLPKLFLAGSGGKIKGYRSQSLRPIVFGCVHLGQFALTCPCVPSEMLLGPSLGLGDY